MAAKKTKPVNKRVAPITREQFRQSAPVALTATIGEFPVGASRKEFATGSLGWYGNGKVTLNIGGVPVDCQVGITVAVIGSKELPQ